MNSQPAISKRWRVDSAQSAPRASEATVEATGFSPWNNTGKREGGFSPGEMPAYDRSMRGLAAAVLILHLVWILWVLAGVLFTRGRPWLTAFHLASLAWGIVVEIGPWPCPLTMAENYLETHAGMETYSGSFIVHYLDKLIYPNIPVAVIIWFAVAVCGANLLVYAWRLKRALIIRANPVPPTDN